MRLDSLDRVQWRTGGHGTPITNHLNRFDTIVIDKSEQVLSHFLSTTMAEKRETVFVVFRALLRNAKRIIALDADLGWITVEVLTKLANDPTHLPRVRKNARPMSYVYLNEYSIQKSIDIYNSENHLLADMKQSLVEGKRVFVTSNSKRRIDSIEAAMAELMKEKRVIKITSDTSKSKAQAAFIANPSVQGKLYDAILTSPSLGTGVDISFEDQQQQIDVVYGFFDTRITTHFDFDQQLARVRHPGAVKVWISPRTFRFDTATDVVKRDLMHANAYKNFLKEFDAWGAPLSLKMIRFWSWPLLWYPSSVLRKTTSSSTSSN